MELSDINISQAHKDKFLMVSLTCGSQKKVGLIEVESRIEVNKGGKIREG
jgi:hypothetical protein